MNFMIEFYLMISLAELDEELRLEGRSAIVGEPPKRCEGGPSNDVGSRPDGEPQTDGANNQQAKKAKHEPKDTESTLDLNERWADMSI